MKDATRLLVAAALGVTMALSLEAAGQDRTGGMENRIIERLDDLKGAIAQLQAQTAKAASADEIANAKFDGRLANISAQLTDLNAQVIGISGRASKPSR
jgi:hypothetical protein